MLPGSANLWIGGFPGLRIDTWRTQLWWRCLPRSNVDQTVKPSDDFCEYANGGWLKRTEILFGIGCFFLGDLPTPGWAIAILAFGAVEPEPYLIMVGRRF